MEDVVHEVTVSGLPKELGIGDKAKALAGGVVRLGVQAAKMYLAAKTGGLTKAIGVDRALDMLMDKGQTPGDISDKFQAIGVDRVSEKTVDQLFTATFQNGAVFKAMKVCNKADHDNLMGQMPGFKDSFASFSQKYASLMETISPNVSNGIRSAVEAINNGDYRAMDTIMSSTSQLGTTLDLGNQMKMKAAQKEASRGLKEVNTPASTPSATPAPKR